MSGSSKKEGANSLNKYPKTRFGWLWENMEGKHRLFIIALIGTAVYNIMQLIVPYFSGRIVDLLRDIQEKNLNLADYKDDFLKRQRYIFYDKKINGEFVNFAYFCRRF